MNISRGRVVRFHYTLKNEQGQALESTQDGEPMVYLHGYRNIIDSLEQVLEGRSAGEKFSSSIEARDRPLRIEIEVLEVRDATQEETLHGHAHAHGPGGCGH